ncbi:hypothetical protein UCDDA912_g09886 [Diaporthe ampelina]|uniref:2EXR domain-containing protein n=1 Tax=Diaporthe ampelina TaxID=1214573 RepID=A0A0G2F7G9_9PEZI|nr:hypothetical protein UCDDA912_g09886 [Diaporthe ampelina]
MEAQKPTQQASLAFRPRIKTSLRQRFTKQKDPAPKAPPQDQQVAQQSRQQNHEAVATHFHHFPDLPTELRLQIWAEAARYKRYVVLEPPCNSAAACARLFLMAKRYGGPGCARGRYRPPAWTSRTPPPALLAVSTEARAVALGTWQRAFGYGVFPATVMRGMHRLTDRSEFMNGLKSLTIEIRDN